MPPSSNVARNDDAANGVGVNQANANQANAQHSTGPQTPQGKATSAQNARTHGLCCKDRLVANEDQLEFEVMEVKLRVDIHSREMLHLRL